ncbi:MAG: metalloregulator ArsR/SmtB family transcription factor, partial [Gammaproteobacteria bacterium]|nr:metalloregulator ArsR/SmtB family transcription factor [Gammaproteobacteria bacterium]
MDELLNRLRAAAERTRLRLLHILSHNELTVSEITTVLDQSQPRVSRHLKILCEAGLLDRTQEGASVFYRLAQTGPVAELTQNMLALLPEQDDQLQRDLARLEDIKRQHAAAASKYFKDNAEEWERIRTLYLAD